MAVTPLFLGSCAIGTRVARPRGRCCHSRLRSRTHRRTELGRDPCIEIIWRIERNSAVASERWPATNHRKFGQRAGGTVHALSFMQVLRSRLPAEKSMSTHSVTSENGRLLPADDADFIAWFGKSVTRAWLV